MGTFIAVVRRRAINSRALTHSYHAARMLNQIRRGHVLAKKWGGHGCPCRPYAAALELALFSGVQFLSLALLE